MNTAALIQQPFVQVALPIIIALMLAAWLQNKRFDDVNRRIDEQSRRIDEQSRHIDELRTEVIQHLGRIEVKLDNHNERSTRFEERTSLVR